MKLIPLVLSTALLCSQVFLAARADELPAQVKSALVAAGIPLSATSFIVQEVEKPEYRIAHNGQTPMNPASLMKLVTTFSALELLGPTFTWRTGVFITGPVNNGALDGDVIIRGSGDPKLVAENVWLMLRKLQAAGVTEIRGDILLDRSAFDVAELDSGKFDGEVDRPYNVGADALLMNYKSISYTFIANGVAAGVGAEPPMAGMQLPAAVRTSVGACGDWKARLGASFSEPLAPRFSGSYPASCGEKTWHIGALTPQRYAQGLITQTWKELGGKLRGKVRDGAVPSAGARLLFEWQSPALAEVIRDINKFSNNVMARQLFLTIAAETTQQAANAKLAEKAIKDWALQRGLAIPELVMENGSGLSRDERISGAGLARVLQAAYGSAVMPELISSLPVAGLDGTMKRRKGHIAQGNAHIKTGSLRDVAGIAGVVHAVNGRRYVIVAIVNHDNANGSRAAIDALLAWTYNGAGQ